MILREKVTIDIGGQSVDTYAEVIPLTTTQSAEIQGWSSAMVNYRIILPPLAQQDIPQSTDSIRWNGTVYQMLGPCMRHHINGKLHHLEAFISR